MLTNTMKNIWYSIVTARNNDTKLNVILSLALSLSLGVCNVHVLNWNLAVTLNDTLF